MVQKRQGEVLSKLNKFTQRLKANKPHDWMCHNLKFHIDSQNAYNFNKNKIGRQEEDDGGLKVEFDKYEMPKE